MQTIHIDKLLENRNSIHGLLFDNEEQVELDFSNVEEIRFSDIQKLLDIQKLAVFNDLSLRIAHLEPSIRQILEQTGLYKTLNSFSIKEGRSIPKRMVLE